MKRVIGTSVATHQFAGYALPSTTLLRETTFCEKFPKKFASDFDEGSQPSRPMIKSSVSQATGLHFSKKLKELSNV